MCRFFIIKSRKKIKPENLLKPFASACQKSIAPDGELQKDGYGIAWQDGKSWQLKKSLAPIWKEQDLFEQIPDTNLLVAHARSAGFAKDKDNLDYNQPFIDGGLCFVFNGMIRKVKISTPLMGDIGSQKLFFLIKLYTRKLSPEKVLRKIQKIILKHSEKVEGMNIGLINNNQISIICQYSDNKDYFSLHFYEDEGLILISSIPIGSYKWRIMKSGEVKSLSLS